MDFRALNRGELLAIIGGILLAVSLFLAWYSLGNRYARSAAATPWHTAPAGTPCSWSASCCWSPPSPPLILS